VPFLSISEVADRMGCRPRDVSDLLYQRKIDPRTCLIKGGRRLLPESILPEIETLLRRAGRVAGFPAIETRDAG